MLEGVTTPFAAPSSLLPQEASRAAALESQLTELRDQLGARDEQIEGLQREVLTRTLTLTLALSPNPDSNHIP